MENTEDNRRGLRELLVATPGCEDHISGVVRQAEEHGAAGLLDTTRVCAPRPACLSDSQRRAQILYEETLRQSTSAGVPFPSLLAAKGMVPGIKLDIGTQALPGGRAGETWTAGLDTLAHRAAASYAAGARFAKWRAVVCVDAAQGLPSDLAVAEAAHTLGRYARTCQEAGLVPIIEPEVLADGQHSMQECSAVTERVLHAVFAACQLSGVLLPGCLLKPNMVTPGLACTAPASTAAIAEATLEVLLRCVPPAVPGVMFLSGGQSEEQSTERLGAIVAAGAARRAPWVLSFSYGRALQHSAIRAWKGSAENIGQAQSTFLERCGANGAAAAGGSV